MKPNALVNIYTNKLSAFNPKTARLEALMILEIVIGRDRSYLLAHPELQLDVKQSATTNDLVERRLSGEPMAYILGKKEFYGREFIVTPDVLIPRPESETIIELLTKYYGESTSFGKKLLDVGTGSGCLAITAKLEAPEFEVSACDISKAALAVAKKNTFKLNTNINFFESDLLNNTQDTYDVIIANLPYVPRALKVSIDVLAEPKVAVFSGDDGLLAITRLLKQCHTKLNIGGLVILESLEMQHPKIINIAEANNLKLLETKGLIQVYQL